MARARNVRGRILDLARDLGLQLRGCRARQLHVDDDAGEVEVRHLGDLQRVKAEKAGDGRQKKQQDRRRRAMNRPSRKIHVHDASKLTRSPSPMKRSEEHTSELQTLMRISYAGFCLKKHKETKNNQQIHT